MITRMRVEDILMLPSIDSDGFASVDDLDDDEIGEYYSLTVADLMESKSDDLEYGSDNSTPEEYNDIREAMRENGINEIPIHVTFGKHLCPMYGVASPDKYRESLVMGNGHHRVALALKLGHEYMQVTDDIIESGW